MRRTLATVVAACAVFSIATEGRALTLEFSDGSTDGTPASALEATLDIEVSGNSLTLTVTNLSDYRITELYFNTSSDVTSLALNAVTGGGGIQFWHLEQSQHIGGFGTFDYAILGGNGRRSSISPGESAVFTLEISSIAPVEDLDFYQQSSPDGDHSRAHAAAKFVAGRSTTAPSGP